MMKPQLKFDPKPDNSYFQFVPLINEKINGLTDLNPQIIELQKQFRDYQTKNKFHMLEDDRPVKMVPHPYADEIQSFKLS